jgi:nitroreductase
MDVFEAIRNRRAVREYADTPIDRKTVSRLIEIAIQAPSSMNLQPWAFAVLLDPNRIADLDARAKRWLLDNFSRTGFDLSLRTTLEEPGHLIFYRAPALVLILAKSADPQSAQDCCLAAQNFMLAARNEDLGTCWIGIARPWLSMNAIKAELQVPEDYDIIAPIVLGHPKAWPEPHGRQPAEIHWLG